jgi:hypothetical protein
MVKARNWFEFKKAVERDTVYRAREGEKEALDVFLDIHVAIGNNFSRRSIEDAQRIEALFDRGPIEVTFSKIRRALRRYNEKEWKRTARWHRGTT